MAVTEIGFDVAEVKLVPPPTRPDTVSKSNAIESLRASPVPLSTIVAPAGYGKTTLLAQWAAADVRPFAWFAVDAGDDDVVMFLRYIAAAVHRVEPLPPEVLESLSGPGDSWVRRIPRLGGALAARTRPLVLVLDDLHTVSNPACFDAVAELVRYVPDGSQIVIASREEPKLPLARWRAQGAVHEIGVADLRMDERESRQLIEAAGVELDETELIVLTERTEGWAAGLYLAALAFQAGGPVSASAMGFDGDDRFVSEYLRSELLSRLPPAEAQFLKHTSVLDRMCGGLCDAVLETTGSAERLEALERSNGFVVPLDRRGEWYRYHHLFGRLLRDELERTEPEMVVSLTRRAMAWSIANDMSEAAVDYGLRAGETDTVAGIIDAALLPIYYDGRRETVTEWLGRFSEKELKRYPSLVVYHAWLCALTGHGAEAERWLAVAEGTTSTIPLSDGSATIEPWVATLRSHMLTDGAARAVTDADLALSQLHPQSEFIPDALLGRAFASALLGETDRATTDLEAAIRAGSERLQGPPFLAHALLSVLAAKHGAWDEADQHALAAQALVKKLGFGEYSATALAHVATARVALHNARLDDVRLAVARAHRLRPLLDHGLPAVTVMVGLELTRIHLALTDVAAARSVLADTERVLELRPQLGTAVDEARELRALLAATSGPRGAWAMSLTAAELRLLPYLATHLTIPEIATRLFISRNTVKTEAVSIYRKLSSSSRSEAIERAIEAGLLDGSIYPAGSGLG